MTKEEKASHSFDAMVDQYNVPSERIQYINHKPKKKSVDWFLYENTVFLTLCNLLKLDHKLFIDNETGNDLQRMICSEILDIKKKDE